MRRFSILCISVARTQNLLASIKHGFGWQNSIWIGIYWVEYDHIWLFVFCQHR